MIVGTFIPCALLYCLISQLIQIPSGDGSAFYWVSSETPKAEYNKFFWIIFIVSKIVDR